MFVNVMPFLNVLGFAFVPGLCCMLCGSISDLSGCMSIYVTKQKVGQLIWSINITKLFKQEW